MLYPRIARQAADWIMPPRAQAPLSSRSLRRLSTPALADQVEQGEDIWPVQKPEGYGVNTGGKKAAAHAWCHLECARQNGGGQLVAPECPHWKKKGGFSLLHSAKGISHSQPLCASLNRFLFLRRTVLLRSPSRKIVTARSRFSLTTAPYLSLYFSSDLVD